MSLELKIKFENMNEVLESLKKKELTPNECINISIKAAVKGRDFIIREYIKDEHKKSGITAAAWQVNYTNGNVELVNETATSVWLEKGTRAHEILPKEKKILLFPSKSFSKTYTRLTGIKREGSKRYSKEQYRELIAKGDLIVARKVNHPGTKAGNYMEKSQPVIMETLNIETKKVLEK